MIRGRLSKSTVGRGRHARLSAVLVHVVGHGRSTMNSPRTAVGRWSRGLRKRSSASPRCCECVGQQLAVVRCRGSASRQPAGLDVALPSRLNLTDEVVARPRCSRVTVDSVARQHPIHAAARAEVRDGAVGAPSAPPSSEKDPATASSSRLVEDEPRCRIDQSAVVRSAGVGPGVRFRAALRKDHRVSSPQRSLATARRRSGARSIQTASPFRFLAVARILALCFEFDVQARPTRSAQAQRDPLRSLARVKISFSAG